MDAVLKVQQHAEEISKRMECVYWAWTLGGRAFHLQRARAAWEKLQAAMALIDRQTAGDASDAGNVS